MAGANATSSIPVTVSISVADFTALQAFLDGIANSVDGAKIVQVQAGQANY